MLSTAALRSLAASVDRPSVPVARPESILPTLYIMAIPLRYETQAVQEITSPRNSLLVFARGLGVLSVQAHPLLSLTTQQPKPLILLINYKPTHLSFLRRSNLVISHIDEDKVAPNHRKQFYQQRGILSFSAKMVIVDLLEGVLNPLDVTFIFVYEISRLSTSSNERFLAELCLTKNPTCYAKLFSEHPEEISPIFDTLTRLFYLQKSLFFPRSDANIDADLTLEPTHSSQILLKPSKTTARLRSILHQFCTEALNEIKRKNPDKDLTRLSFDTCLLHKYKRILQQNVDVNVRNLNYTTRVLVQNVKEIMRIYRNLENEDVTRIYRNFMYILKENCENEASLWLNTQFPDLIDELKVTFRRLIFTVKSDLSVLETHKPPRKWVELAKYIENCTSNGGHWGSILIFVSGFEDDLQYFLTTRRLKAGDLVPNFHLKRLLEEFKDELLLGTERSEVTRHSLERLYTEVNNQFEPSQEVSKRPRSDSEAVLSQPSVLETLGYQWSSEYAPGWRVTFNSEYDASVLDMEEPTHIVLFSYELGIIREVERYAARRFRMEMTVPKEVFLIAMEGSAELRTMDLMKDSEETGFEQLKRLEGSRSQYIRPIPEPEPLTALSNGHSAGRLPTPPTIIIDKREFGSNLPYELYKSGFRLLLSTLTVGDYILSREICVERKNSGSDDIYQSLTSGRLLKQLHKMTRCYTKCVLLLEFQEGTAFSLSTQTVSRSSEKYNINTKLGEVIMQFPRLTVLWSHGVSDTVRLFQRLKEGESEPVFEEAQEHGKKMLNSDGNIVGQNLLLALPGVFVTNVEQLMQRFGNIQRLFTATKQELEEILGDAGASALLAFIEEEYPSSPTS